MRKTERRTEEWGGGVETARRLGGKKGGGEERGREGETARDSNGRLLMEKTSGDCEGSQSTNLRCTCDTSMVKPQKPDIVSFLS